MRFCHCDLFLKEILQKPAFHVFVFVDWFDNQKSEVGFFFIFSLPIFQGLKVSLFVHILTAFSQFLVVDDVDVWAFLPHVLHASCVILQPLYYQFLIDFFLEAERQKSDAFAGQKVLNVAIGSFPFLIVGGLEEDAVLAVGDVDFIAELSLFH